MTHECNRFIIDGGRFVRDFEGMYRHFEDPWDQAADAEIDLFSNTALFLLRHVVLQSKTDIKAILDAGCAFGYHALPLLSLATPDAHYTGLDVSETAIRTAARSAPQVEGSRMSFRVLDLRLRDPALESKFDLVFSSKTLYYVAPEIDQVLVVLQSYLRPQGLLCFVYNTRRDAFSSRWLTYEDLRHKLLERGFACEVFAELNRFEDEVGAVGVFRAP